MDRTGTAGGTDGGMNTEFRETGTLAIGADGAGLVVSPCQKRLSRPALVPRLVGGPRPMPSRRSVRKTL